MSHRQLLQWGVATTLVMSLLSGCGGATPTPIIIVPAATSISAPSIPTAARPIATAVPPTEALPTASNVPPSVATDLTTTAEGTATLESVPTAEDPINRPFLMKIDRISTIVGRGTLLEGRVVHGTLQGNGNVEILGPQNSILSTSVLAVLISSIVRDQVTVGDYAGILVEGIDATELSPGMLLVEAGAFESYEEALQELQ